MRGVILSLACIFGLLKVADAEMPSVQRHFERGLASWYGAPYHGRQSASGAVYDQEQLTAAHRTLPFGSVVRVRRVDGDGSVVVRINDRGPFLKSRIVDLSHAAAVLLGIVRRGVAPVTLEVLEVPTSDRSSAAAPGRTAFLFPNDARTAAPIYLTGDRLKPISFLAASR
jgi:rare lipoprotein A (peptidoglycan hydrolase)